ncbi:hypothetical protein AVEN_143996-1, partial [Araneus ventricosus]
MTRTTPEPAPPLQTSAPHQREDVSPPTYDLTCNRPNTQCIYSGIGFRAWTPSDPKADSLSIGHSGLSNRKQNRIEEKE